VSLISFLSAEYRFFDCSLSITDSIKVDAGAKIAAEMNSGKHETRHRCVNFCATKNGGKHEMCHRSDAMTATIRETAAAVTQLAVCGENTGDWRCQWHKGLLP
jgi:hypothetical protein